MYEQMLKHQATIFLQCWYISISKNHSNIVKVLERFLSVQSSVVPFNISFDHSTREAQRKILRQKHYKATKQNAIPHLNKILKSASLSIQSIKHQQFLKLEKILKNKKTCALYRVQTENIQNKVLITVHNN